jgi:protein involved in polysaccharide export with SLBB domain
MLKNLTPFVITLAAASIAGASATLAQGKSAPALLMSRAELTSAAERADGSIGGDAAAKMRNAMIAASLRQRLRDGDFQIGDRLVLSYVTDVSHLDTLVVRSGRVVELPGKIIVSLSGVLRSEVEDRVSTELMKYVRAEQIEVTPLMRVGVLGDVAHPGFFAFASDIPLTDAIMGAGGPTATADLDRSVVRRGTVVYKSADETRTAIARGLTLDQFGLSAGDELVIGQRPGSRSGALLGVVGGLGTLITVFVALGRH